MKCEKGKLDVEIDPEILPRIVNDCEATICQMVADDPQDIANAKELVRRWNAFEKDGLVDELVGVLEQFVKGHKSGAAIPLSMLYKKAEAAIAQAQT